MKAWLLDAIPSTIEALRLSDVGDPVPRAGEVLLRVEFAALNPADRYLAMGQYPAKPALPHILGRDAVGVVEAVGPGVDPARHPVGTRRLLLRSDVGVTRPGTLAQRVAAAAESLVEPPAQWSPEQSAGAPLVYLTAHQALTMWEDVPAGAVVLVTGASGGVGVAAMHLANAMGHEVVAVSRGSSKRPMLIEQGADHVVDAQEADWGKTLVSRMPGGRRVNLAVDNVAGPMFQQVIQALAEKGRVSCVGQLAGPVAAFSPATLFFRRIRIGGVAVGAYTAAQSQEAWGAIVRRLESVGRRPVVDSVWTFEEVKQAFARLGEGPMGKVVVRVGASST